MKHGISRIALMAALTAGAAQAQDTTTAGDVVVLDTITLTANRTETEASRTGVSVSVLDAQDVRDTGDVSPLTALSRLPGVSVSQDGPFGSTANLRIRGADSRYIAVFFDGIRITDPSAVTTSLNFGMLPAMDIDRIEVLRGSQSALWGGSAVGGVISMQSRRPTQEGVSQDAAIQVGSEGTAALRYSVAQKTGALETALTLSHTRTDGFSAAANGTEADGAEASRLSMTARYAVSEALSVGGALFYQDTSTEFDGFDETFTLVDMDNTQDRREGGARLFAELSAGNSTHLFDVTHYRIRRDISDESGDSRFEGERTGFSWLGTTEVSSDLTLVYGADTMKEEAEYSNLPGGVADTRISGVFAQGLWAVTPDLDLSATLRRDDHSRFGGFTSGRLAAAWRPADGTTVRAAYATGFRAPSIDELYGDYPAFFFTGNPDLEAEESESYELGIEQEFAGGATVSATVFKLDISNMIASTADFSTLENVDGTSKRQGVELAASVPLGERVKLGMAYTYTDAKRADDIRVALVPRHNLTLSLDAEVATGLTAGLAVHYVSDRMDNFSSFVMDDYTVVDARMSYDLDGDTQIWGGVNNLFDEEYQTSNTFAAPGRTFHVGLRKAF